MHLKDILSKGDSTPVVYNHVVLRTVNPRKWSSLRRGDTMGIESSSGLTLGTLTINARFGRDDRLIVTFDRFACRALEFPLGDGRENSRREPCYEFRGLFDLVDELNTRIGRRDK